MIEMRPGGLIHFLDPPQAVAYAVGDGFSHPFT
jgi:hypothetical protein